MAKPKPTDWTAPWSLPSWAVVPKEAKTISLDGVKYYQIDPPTPPKIPPYEDSSEFTEVVGWKKLEPYEFVKAGDVLAPKGLLPGTDLGKFFGKFSDNENRGIADMRKSMYVYMDFWAYRKTGPTRLPLNPYFSEPLPLP